MRQLDIGGELGDDGKVHVIGRGEYVRRDRCVGAGHRKSNLDS
jgi:hypothetical protein